MKSTHRFFVVAAAAAVAASLSACGGGEGSGIGSIAGSATVSGTAATGAAIVGGAVSSRCVSGSTTGATTGADGSFTLDVGAVTLPCVARVDYKDAAGTAQRLHSLISALGTANITPVTELLVANLSGGAPADAFDKFDASKAKDITAAKIKAAADAVKAYLKTTLGVDTTNLPDDPIGTKFAPKTASRDGDKLDKVLDDVQARLKTLGRKLGDASGDVAKSGSGGVATSAGGGTGCTGDVAVFFAKNKGSYPSKGESFGGTGTVAGVANGQATIVIVADNCTVTVGSSTLSYRDGSFSKSPNGQIDVSLSGTGFGPASSYEVFADGAGLASLNDTRTSSFMNFFTPKK